MPREEADPNLIERAKHDRSAFAELYRLYLPRVHAFCQTHSQSRDEAEDLTSQTFERALRALPRYQARGVPLSSRLFRIAANLAIDRGRRSGHVINLDRGRQRYPALALATPQRGHLAGYGRTAVSRPPRQPTGASKRQDPTTASSRPGARLARAFRLAGGGYAGSHRRSPHLERAGQHGFIPCGQSWLAWGGAVQRACGSALGRARRSRGRRAAVAAHRAAAFGCHAQHPDGLEPGTSRSRPDRASRQCGGRLPQRDRRSASSERGPGAGDIPARPTLSGAGLSLCGRGDPRWGTGYPRLVCPDAGCREVMVTAPVTSAP